MKTSNQTWLAKHALAAYFVLAYALTWSLWVPIALSARGLIALPVPPALYYLGSFGPLLSALIITALTRGLPGLKQLISGLLRWRVAPRYYLFAVLVPLGLFALAAALNRLLSGAWPDLSLLGRLDYLPAPGILPSLLLWLLTYGLGEETGWRGFALPRLQQRRSPLASALILGVIWTCWHIPAFFFRDTYMAMGFFVLPAVLFSISFASIIFTWLYNATGGSLLVVIIFHALFDWLSVSDAGGPYAASVMGMTIVLWAVFIMRSMRSMRTTPAALSNPAGSAR